MKTFLVQLLFQAAIKSYSIYCPANNNVLTILVQSNSSGKCTFKKKSRNDQDAIEETEP